MKYAIISDIHGNYPALVKVLEDARSYNVDIYIFLGDYIFDLPFSNEIIQCIRKLDNKNLVLGNKEIQLKKLSEEDQSGWIYEQIGVIYQTYRELSKEIIRIN